MRKILDKMFANKKLSLIIPTAIALLMYLLFVLFGTSADKTNLMTVTPIVSVIGFFGIFLVIFVQVKTINQTDITSLENMREDELRTEISNFKQKIIEEAQEKELITNEKYSKK